MGYTINVTGEIKIVPPITHRDLAAVRSFVHGSGNRERHDVWIDVDESEVETAEGTLIRRQGVAIIPDDNDFSHYDMQDEIAEIVAAFPDRSYEGHLECSTPDDGGEQWRLMIKDGVVVTVKPKVTWAEGEDG